MNETQLNALLAHIDARADLRIANRDGEYYSAELEDSFRSTKAELWSSFGFFEPVRPKPFHQVVEECLADNVSPAEVRRRVAEFEDTKEWQPVKKYPRYTEEQVNEALTLISSRKDDVDGSPAGMLERVNARGIIVHAIANGVKQ